MTRATFITERAEIKRFLAAVHQHRHPSAVRDRLCQLDGATCSAAEIDAIVGNHNWGRITCACCGESVTSAVRFTRQGHVAGIFLSVDICRSCLEAGNRLIEVGRRETAEEIGESVLKQSNRLQAAGLGPYEEIDLNEEEERALDEVWEERQRDAEEERKRADDPDEAPPGST